MTLLLILLLAVVALLAYVAYPLVRASRIDRVLVPASEPFSLDDASRDKTILILGDSTAVGVGATPEESVAGRLSEYFGASVENYSKSGAVTADLDAQLSRAKLRHYDLIHIQIGANDVIGMRSLDAAAESLDAVLTKQGGMADRVSLLTAGDIGKSPMFKWPLSLLMSHRTRELRTRFIEVAAKHDVIYVDIYTKPDIFSEDPDRYHARDGLHLSGEGYLHWFKLLLEEIETKG